MAIYNSTKVGFRAGTQAQIDAIIESSKNNNGGINQTPIIDGYFYLATDTQKLYIGLNGGLRLVGNKEVTNAFIDAEYIEEDKSLSLTPKFVLGGDSSNPISGNSIRFVAKKGLDFNVSEKGVVIFEGTTGDEAYVELEGKISENAQSIRNVSGNVTNLSTRVDVLDSAVSSLVGSDGSLNDRLNGMETAINSKASATDFDDLKDKVTILEGNMVNEDGPVKTLQNDVEDLKDTISAHATDIGNLQSNVTSHETSIGTLGGDVGKLKGAVFNEDGSSVIGTLRDSVTSLQGTVNTHDSDLSDVKTSISNLNNKEYLSETLNVEKNAENNSVSFNLNWIVHPATGQE